MAAKQLFMLCDDVIYEVDSLIKTVDTYVKSFFVFNMQYPAEAVDVWTFLQRRISEITTPYGIMTPRVHELLGQIQSH